MKMSYFSLSVPLSLCRFSYTFILFLSSFHALYFVPVKKNKERKEKVDLFNGICLKSNWKMYSTKCKINIHLSVMVSSRWNEFMGNDFSSFFFPRINFLALHIHTWREWCEKWTESRRVCEWLKSIALFCDSWIKRTKAIERFNILCIDRKG